MLELRRSRMAASLLTIAVAAGALIVGQSAERWMRSAPSAVPLAFEGDLRPTTDRQLAAVQARIQRDPTDGTGAATLGQLYLQKARETGDPAYYPRADAAFARALELDDGNAAALAGLGALALSRHQFLEALAWGERARAAAPRTAMVHGVVGDAHIELGDYERAVASYQTMIDLRPDLNSYARVSYARELHGDRAGAIEAMELAAQSGVPGYEGTAWAHVQLGSLHFESGQISAAEREYRLALQNVPDYPHGLAGLGRVEAARASYDFAISLYLRATERVPVLEHIIALADVYLAADRPDEGARQVELIGAIEKLHAANGVDTDLEMALFDLDHDRDVSQALNRIEAQINWRANVKVRDALAWALYKNRDCERAEEEVQGAMRLGTRDALMYFHAGLIARCLGLVDVARARLEQALKINPYFSPLHGPYAREALASLAADGVGGSEGVEPL